MRLTEEYSVKSIALILKELDERNRYSYQDVLSILRYQRQCTNGTQSLATDILKELNVDHIHTTYLPLDMYDKLVKESYPVICQGINSNK